MAERFYQLSMSDVLTNSIIPTNYTLIDQILLAKLIGTHQNTLKDLIHLYLIY